MNNPKVSVLMSVYNECEEWLKESMNSILNQSYENIEFIIVLDNPQNYAAINLIKEFKCNDSKIKFIINDKNIGLAESLNKAFKLSTGELIARMDADDISANNRIENQVKQMINNKLDFISSRCEYIDQENNSIRIQKTYPNGKKFINQAIKYRNWFVHPTWLLKRELFESLGGYRAFPALEDYDFIYRIIDKNYRIEVTDDVLLKYRVNFNGMTMTKGLVQYKLSKYILNLHKQRKRFGQDNFSKYDIKNIIEEKCNNEDFYIYQKYIDYVRNESFFYKKILLSLKYMLISKYFREHIKDSILFNLLCKLHKITEKYILVGRYK